jgi:hypothetical protein
MDDLFDRLTEEDHESSVGDAMFENEQGFYLVPFVHHQKRFFVYFMPTDSDPALRDALAQVIAQDANHILSKSSYTLKFGPAEGMGQEKMFEKTGHSVGQLFNGMSSKLILSVKKLIQATTADEFYFIAGAEDEKRQRQLDIWYSRMGRSMKSHNFYPIHNEPNGGWYGYKTAP